MATVQPPPAASSAAAPPKHELFVEEQLRHARRRIRNLDLLAASLGFLVGTLVYGLGMILLDRWLNLPSLIRQVALGVYVVGAAAYILFAMVRPLMRQINPYYAARKVEQFVPGAKNSVINWLDLRDRKLPPAIRGAVGQRAARDLGKADLDQALSGRPEILQTRLSLEAGEHQRRARLYALLPEIDLEGAYLRSYGQVIVPTNSEFIGINAKWAIWEWGASYAAYRASQAQARAAAFDLENQKQQIRAEVTSGMAQLDAAASAISVAEQAITSAQEAYRVTDAQLQAGTATTTDLLEAQSALTQARLNYLRAQYELAISRVNLRRALGQ